VVNLNQRLLQAVAPGQGRQALNGFGFCLLQEVEGAAVLIMAMEVEEEK
jgi:hypothetical protein